jgi:hypothetical protein
MPEPFLQSEQFRSPMTIPRLIVDLQIVPSSKSMDTIEQNIISNHKSDGAQYESNFA